MSEISVNRLMLGGVLGPIEAAFYIVGFWHIFLALKPAGKIPAYLTFGALSWSVIVGAGAYHSSFVFKGLLLRAKHAAVHPQAAWFQSLFADSSRYTHLLYTVMFVLGLAATFVFLFAVLRGRTHYPRWMVLFIPTLWVLLLPILASHVPPPAGGMLLGGSVNLSFLLYFCVSTLLLWNRGGRPQS